MRIVCSTFGSAGDVFPLLGLALELRSRGHSILFVTNSHFESLVRHHELEFAAMGTDADFDACIRNPALWEPKKAFSHVVRTVQPILRDHYQVLVEENRKGPFASIANCFGFSARLAHETMQVPTLTFHLQPAPIWSRIAPPKLPGLFGPPWLQNILFNIGERFLIDPAVCPWLNPWRRELGLQPIKKVTRWWNSPDGVLCFFPRWFAPAQADWPSPVFQAEFPLWNANSDSPLSPMVAEFLEAGTPPLVFTPGSANVHGADFFDESAKACELLGERGILLTKYPEQIPSHLPANVIHVPYVPLDQLLPRCRAFVHHGGIGSLSQGFAAGIPQVIRPLAHDQFDNADRLQKLGAGGSLSVHDYSAGRLAVKLKSLLDQPAVHSACQQFAERMNERTGLAEAAQHVEKAFAGRL